MNTSIKQFLEKLRKRCLSENVPIISEQNAQFLHWLCRSRQVSNILEIGCADGYSTIWLADAINSEARFEREEEGNLEMEDKKWREERSSFSSDKNSVATKHRLSQPDNPKIISIELSAHHFANAQKNIIAAGMEDCIDLRFGSAQEILPTLESDQFDFIFVDARKNAYAEFFQLCQRLLKPNGCIVFDDVIKFRHKMEDFYQVIESNDQFCHQIIPIDEDDGVMLVWEAVK